MKQESASRIRSATGAPQIAGIFDRRAEAGRANQRAVGAREAARGDFIPMGMLQVVVDQFRQIVRLELALDLPLGVLHSPGRPPEIKRRGRLPRECRATSPNPRLSQPPPRKSSGSSVSAKSKPLVARGPVFIEVQKHVGLARPQLTASTKTFSRRRA